MLSNIALIPSGYYSGPGLPKNMSGFLPVKTDVDLIVDSINQILSTRVGERPMIPEFGSRIHNLLFEPMGPQFEDQVKVFAVEAINQWEPRVTIQSMDVNIDANNHIVEIAYSFLITKINQTGAGLFVLQTE